MGKWKLLGKESIYKDHWKSLERWRMENPHGRASDFTIVVNLPVVMVFGITADDRVLVTREYYMSQRKKILSMVAGTVEQEDIKQVAIDELREEAGCTAEEMIYLGRLNHGKYTVGDVHFFLAKNVQQTGKQELEENEDIDVEFVALSEFKKLLRADKLKSMYEATCAYKALDYLKKL